MQAMSVPPPTLAAVRQSPLQPQMVPPVALRWLAHANLSPDATILSMWWALEGLVPEHGDSRHPVDRDALQAAHAPDHATGTDGETAVRAFVVGTAGPSVHGAPARQPFQAAEAFPHPQDRAHPSPQAADFRLLTSISLDGVFFPDMLESFQAELLEQVQELHYGRGGLHMGLSRLVVPIDPSDPADDHDAIRHMQGAFCSLWSP